jgi:hypothetical protein
MPHELMPIDQIAIAYFSLTALLILLFHRKLSRWYFYLVAHLIVIIAVFLLKRLPTSYFVPFTPPVSFTFFLGPRFWRESYPLFMIPLLYREVSQFNRLIVPRYLDETIIKLEGRVFFGQPSIYLSHRLPSVWLSEYLHACYFSYYFLVPALGFLLYFSNLAAFRVFVFSVFLAFEVCCLLYILFPVLGPYYWFEPIGAPLSRQPFYKLTHRILKGGSSRGTAFPSSHVAVAVVVLGSSFKYLPETFFIFCPVIVGLIFGTVYCRFHYAIDAAAGIFIGLLFYLIGQAI